MGALSLAAGVEVNTDSVFEIGSIAKLWTATPVMQIADEGVIGLDVPVRDRLPGFRIADESEAAAVEKYVALLAEVPQLLAPG